MIDAGQTVALRATRALYWVAVVVCALIGLLVVLPFYAYHVPAVGAGDLQVYDVKQYWPFGFDGPGRVVHNLGIILAFVAPLVVPATLVWSVLNYLGSAGRRLLLLAPAGLSVLIGAAYLVNWRAILAWHLD